jgi:hypothetical protein
MRICRRWARKKLRRALRDMARAQGRIAMGREWRSKRFWRAIGLHQGQHIEPDHES